MSYTKVPPNSHARHYKSLTAKDSSGIARKWKVGDRVVRKNGQSDVIRSLFRQSILLEPYGRNRSNLPAAVLTNVSWELCADLTFDFPLRNKEQ